MRSLARETVYKFLFSQLFNPGDEELFSVLCKNDKLNNEEIAFATNLLNAVQQNYNEIISEIEKFSIGYKIDRIFSTDKCALLIGIAELNYFKDIPQIVVSSTQEILAEDVELTTAYIGQIERGERNLTLESLIKVANRLGVTVDYLLSDSISVQNDTILIQLSQLLNGRTLEERELAVDMLRTLFLHLDRSTGVRG